MGLLMLFAANHSSRSEDSASVPPSDTVIVLHGMGRTKLSMSRLSNHLVRQGYNVINFGYSSTRQSVAESARQLATALQKEPAIGSGKVHFVTHSLGGIIVRACLKEYRPENLGRVVMISPPNRGSEVADKLRNNVFYKWATGPAGQELGTQQTSTPNRLGPVDFPVGVITGSRSYNPLFSAWLGEPNDGKVSISRSRVEGMADFLIVARSHTYIMQSRSVMAQVTRFLSSGEFEHTKA